MITNAGYRTIMKDLGDKIISSLQSAMALETNTLSGGSAQRRTDDVEAMKFARNALPAWVVQVRNGTSELGESTYGGFDQNFDVTISYINRSAKLTTAITDAEADISELLFFLNEISKREDSNYGAWLTYMNTGEGSLVGTVEVEGPEYRRLDDGNDPWVLVAEIRFTVNLKVARA